MPANNMSRDVIPEYNFRPNLHSWRQPRSGLIHLVDDQVRMSPSVYNLLKAIPVGVSWPWGARPVVGQMWKTWSSYPRYALGHDPDLFVWCNSDEGEDGPIIKVRYIRIGEIHEDRARVEEDARVIKNFLDRHHAGQPLNPHVVVFPWEEA